MKRETEYTIQEILNLILRETGSEGFAIAVCNPDGTLIGG